MSQNVSYCRCSGSVCGVDFSPWRDCFLSLCTGIVDVAALGILVDDSPGGYQSDCGRLRADAATVHPVAHCFAHECCRSYPPLCADSDRPWHVFRLIMFTQSSLIEIKKKFHTSSNAFLHAPRLSCECTRALQSSMDFVPLVTSRLGTPVRMTSRCSYMSWPISMVPGTEIIATSSQM